MALAHLVSKILAGGLTAGVFLLWWPRHFPDTGIEGLVIRGLAWTLSFELLLVTFSRVEDMVVQRVSSRLHPRRQRVRARIETAPPRLRTGSVVAMACIGLAAPVAMLTEVANHPLSDEPETKVVKQVIVRKPVVKREVVVKRVVAAPAQARPDAGVVSPGMAPAASASARPAAPRAQQQAPRRTASAPARRAPAANPTPPKATTRPEPAAEQTAPDAGAVPVSGTATTSPSSER